MGFNVSTQNQNPEVAGNSQTTTASLALAAPQPAFIAAPAVPEKNYISVRQALTVLFFRRRLIVAVVGAMVFLTAITVLMIPLRYHSEAKLMVRLGRESVVLDPSATIGEAAVPMEGRDKEINSEIELLKSRMLTEQIVSTLGANRILGHSSTAATSDKAVTAAVMQVEDKLTVEAIPDSNILSIGYDSPDPQLSRDVIAKLIDAYLDARASVYRDQGDLKFFQDQLADAQAEQIQLERKLEEVRDSSGIDNPEQQRTILLTRVDSIQHDIDAASADEAATASSIAELGKQLSELPPKQVIEEGSGAAMDSLDTMRTKVAELRLDEADLSARYQPTAPPLLIIRDKISQAEKELAEAETASSQKTVGINHAYEELSIRRDNELANQASLQSRITSLEAAKAKAQSGLAWIDEVGVKTASLEQQVVLAQANVTKYAGAYEQARIDQEMGQHRISNISVAEPPVLPLSPKGPGRALIALAGLFLALCLGVGSVFVAESVDHTVRRVEHLQGLGLPRTVSIPFVKDYYEPFKRAMTLARLAATKTRVAPRDVIGGADRLAADPVTVQPLRASVRGATVTTVKVNPPGSVVAEVKPARTETIGEPVMIMRTAAARRAGPLASSPRILAAVRGVVEHLLPPNENTPAPRVIGVIGPRPGQGASTIAVHLAIALAHRIDTGLDEHTDGNRVLLLDADLESPTASLLAGVAAAEGLGEWISLRTADMAPLVDKVVRTRQDLLDVLPAGAPRERSPLTARMPAVLQTLAPRYRHVVIDLPSMVESEAAARLAGLCDAVVLVCEADSLRFEAAQQALIRLRDAGAKVALAVLNKRRYPVPEWAYRLS
jgi:uncharacterized protein involved in exopolysaccharide biosynthesis/Mrp family chromosome partitioning ATPase